jgi:RND family efflux transporter MFP subunit
MKKTSSLIICGALLASAIVSCGPGGDAARLARLESKRDALNHQIEELKTKMTQEGSPGQASAETPVAVRIEQIKETLFQHFITIQGTVESDNNILVPPLSPGQVKRILVQVGGRVSQGQVLVELDAAVLESSIVEVENSLALAKTIYERRQRLWDKKIGSEIEYLQAKNNKEALEKRLATLREQYNMTRITSPIDGTVDEILIKEGEMAAAGFGAVRIVQISRLKVTASLAENYISRVKRGDTVNVNIPVLNKDFEAAIKAVSQVIDPQNRTFQIEIAVPARERDVKPNMLAVLTVNDYAHPNALAVPKNIVQETGAEQFLFVAVEEEGRWTAKKRVVRSGLDFKDLVEIVEGLQDGEFVVTFGFQNIADGQVLSVEETVD